MMRLTTLCLALCSLTVLVACGQEEKVQEAPPPPDVTVIVTQAQDVPIFQEFIGQIAGLQDITIRARVEGFLEEIHFLEGSQVEKGALLYILESQQFEEKVAAQMSRVAEAKTMLAKYEGDLNRIRPLAEIKAVSQSDLDTAVANYEASISEVEATQANLRAAKIQLGYTKIYSPLAGIIGKTQAKVGDFVGREPNPVILNTVSRIDTILVHFFITESQYLQVARHKPEMAALEREDLQEPSFELILIDGSVYEHKGKADFVDREVDPTTGAMLAQASFPNPDHLLRPGQFAKVKIQVQIIKDGILIPQRCVSELQGRYSVYVVDAANTVENRRVEVGPKIGRFWLITEGLAPDEKVIYEGLQRAGDGVTVNPTIKETDTLDTEEK